MRCMQGSFSAPALMYACAHAPAMYDPRRCTPITSTKKTIKEVLVRMIYVEMLGHDACFAYIKVSFRGSV